VDISVIIVSYNVKAFLEKCLISVLRAMGDLKVEVIVVDNNSVDDSVHYIRSRFPEVCVISNTENAGFSKANNKGLKRAKGEFVLVLNPDTVVSEDTFSTCIHFMNKHEDAGIVGVKMLDGTGTYLPESKRGLPSPWTSFYKMTGINKLFPKSNLFNGYYMGGLDPEETNQVPVLTGAFMFVRKSVMTEAGNFDEDYFMYGEDIDLCYRVLQKEYKNYYLPETSIIHYKGESTKHSSIQYIKTFYSAMLIFVSKHYKGMGGVVLSQFLKIGILMRGFLSWLHRFIVSSIVPILDLSIMVGTVLAVKYLWAIWYFNDAGHFEPEFNAINLPLYSGIWFVSLALFGAYDKGRSQKRILSGILFGTVAILIAYALVDTSYRTSRAVILIAAPIVILCLSLWSALYERLVGGVLSRRVAIIGSKGESERIMELLNRVDPDVDIVGAISTSQTATDSIFIANIEKLEKVVHEYRIRELIFSASDVEFSEISRWMSKFGSYLKYKIASHESDSIVGSDSKIMAGQLYTSEIQFAIDSALNKRNKRLIDILIALFILIFSPFRILFPNGSKVIAQAWTVLLGRHTWVSYDGRDSKLSELPLLRPGYYSPAMYITSKQEVDLEVHMINYLYAREYSVWRDVDLLLSTKNRKQWREF
jgi:GT2 family glycosyltransferase